VRQTLLLRLHGGAMHILTLQDLRRFTGFSTFFMVLRLFVASNNVGLEE